MAELDKDGNQIEGTPKGTLGDSSEKDKEVSEKDIVPKLTLAYRSGDEDKVFEYNFIKQDDNTYDLDDVSKEALKQGLAKGHFQSLYSKEQQARKNEVNGLAERTRKAEEDLRGIRHKFEPFAPHIKLLTSDPEARKQVENHFREKLAGFGFDPNTKIDPVAAEREELLLTQARLDWEHKAKPNIRVNQRQVLRETVKGISEETVEKVMSYIEENGVTIEPHMVEDKVIGIPLGMNGLDKNQAWQLCMQTPLLAHNQMMSAGKLDNPLVLKEREENVKLKEEMARMRKNVGAPGTGGGTTGSAGAAGKEYVKSLDPFKHVQNLIDAGVINLDD